MLRGLYSVASAMDAAARNQEIVAENLANVTTAGYRRQGSAFEIGALPDDLESATQSMGNTANPRGFTKFESGPLELTHEPYDFALVGNGFFVLEGPNGPVYTRNGSFVRTETGELRARGSGYAVRGGGGPVRIPPEASQVSVSPEGAILVNGSEVAKLELATFDNPETLRRVGSTLFEGDNARTPTDVRVEQGYREGSNVQAVNEMISMMLGMRYYEAGEKAMRAISEAVALNTRGQQ